MKTGSRDRQLTGMAGEFLTVVPYRPETAIKKKKLGMLFTLQRSGLRV